MGFGFRNLTLYQDLKRYVVFLYRVARNFPVEETYGLQSQLTRAAASTLLNFSEGMMSISSKERARFLQISIGSIGEVIAIADLALELHYLSSSQHEQILLQSEIIIKRLYGMKRKKSS